MSIKAHLEQAVKNLEAEKERVALAKKEEVTRDKIVPFNQEMDIARDKAISEKQSALNATIVAHQEQFAKEKKEIYDAAEKKKADNANTVIATETYTVTVEYDKAISKLKQQIQEIKE